MCNCGSATGEAALLICSLTTYMAETDFRLLEVGLFDRLAIGDNEASFGSRLRSGLCAHTHTHTFSSGHDDDMSRSGAQSKHTHTQVTWLRGCLHRSAVPDGLGCPGANRTAQKLPSFCA